MQMESSSSRPNTVKESKENIINIFSELFDYINDCNVFLRSIHKSGAQFQALINADEVKLLSSLVEKVKGIQSVISRDNMKCVFFGRTSNGKSTTINAMLGDRILPAGMGHTTSCFLEIRATKESQGSVSIIPSPCSDSDSPPVEHMQIDSLRQLAQAISSTKLPTNSLIRIDWPSQNCALLSEDVVILDSPGFSNYPDIDQWIDKYCLDADVFVLVVNSESTLDHTEKDFFHKVRDKLSKPNVFILNNRWDVSADEININEIRKQHLQKCIDFLTEELQVCSKTEAENRIFFVSATEALNERFKNKSESSGFNHYAEGWQGRLAEFTTFEKILKETLFESATKTKFAAHSSQGQDIVGKVSHTVETLHQKCLEKKDAATSLTHKIRICTDKLASLRKAASDASTSDISLLSEKIAQRVADELQDEMLRLGDVINDFNQKFTDEPEKRAKNKIDLFQQLEQQLLNKMNSLCSRDLLEPVQAVSTAIAERFQALVQDEDVYEALHQSVCSEYVVKFDSDCNNISSEFQEDLSSGLNVPELELPVLYMNTEMMTFPILQSGLDEDMVKLPSAKVMLSAEFNKMLVTSLTAGINIFAKKSSYEWSTWTQEEKEKEFKIKYQLYAKNNIEPIIEQTSKHFAEQIEFALKTTLKRRNVVVDGYMHKMQADFVQLEDDMQRYQKIVAESGKLKNTAQDLEKVLKNFHHKYILV